MIVKKTYAWVEEGSQFGLKTGNWFIDGIYCNNCNFPLNSFRYYDQSHPVKYCPGCGGFIDGVENPKPPQERD